MNPSIARDPEGGYRCLIRETNYHYDGSSYHFLDGGRVYRTSTILAHLDENFAAETTDLIDDSMLTWDVPGAWTVGLEDMRLVHAGGTWYGVSVSRGHRHDHLCEMHVSTLAGNKVVHDVIIPSPSPGRHEKNWTPVADSDDVEFLYVLDPPTHMTIRDGKPVIEGPVPPLPRGGPRGGSQVIRTSLGWLCVTHSVAVRADQSRKYLQQFQLLDDDWRLVARSPEWTFGEGDVEFVAGIAETSDGVVLSYGVNDQHARLAEVLVGHSEGDAASDGAASCRCSFFD